MQLVKKHLEHGAVVNFVQIGHRHDAIDGVIAAIGTMYADPPAAVQNPDPLTWDQGIMKDWLIETLLQGAYMREYHLWEKDCKAYFPAMAKRNGEQLLMKSKDAQSFTKLMNGILAAFGVTMPDTILNAIENMREQVNVMKHEAGLELDHFISKNDYAQAIVALEGFWNHLARCERVTG